MSDAPELTEGEAFLDTAQQTAEVLNKAGVDKKMISIVTLVVFSLTTLTSLGIDWTGWFGPDKELTAAVASQDERIVSLEEYKKKQDKANRNALRLNLQMITILGKLDSEAATLTFEESQEIERRVREMTEN